MDSCSFSCTSLPRVLDADFIHLVNGITCVVHDGIDEMIVAVYPLNPCPKALSSLNDMPK